MPLFEKSVPVNRDDISAIIKHFWDLELKELIKGSQNHTFEALNETNGEKFAVRVTPDPHQKHLQRIEDEIFFVRYLCTSGLTHVCAPIDVRSFDPFTLQSPNQEGGAQTLVSHNCIVRAGNLIVVVFTWARGAPLNFLEYRWMLDEKVVRTVGRWLAHCHASSRRFSLEHGDVAARIQRWDQIQESLLAGTPLHPDDEASMMHDPNAFGVIHGDFNCSNYFYDEADDTLSVFDWDQTHRGWYMWDVAQACFTVVMLAEAGQPISGAPVPEANPVMFNALLIEGYESVAGALSLAQIDQLNRMIKLKKHFYESFCREAQRQGDIPPDMKPFIDYIVACWFDRVK